jgi:hypothetical protein
MLNNVSNRMGCSPEQLKSVVDEAAENLSGFIATGPTSDHP